MTDQQLMAEIVKGNNEWFAELVARFDDRIRRYIRNRYNRRHVDDICQDFWFKVFRNIRQYKEGMAVTPWLYTVARNCCIDFNRRRHNRQHDNMGENAQFFADLSQNPLDMADKNDIIEAVRGKIQLLPPNYQQVLILTQIEGLTQAEAADKIGIPVGTVKSRMNKAFIKIRKLYE